MGQGEDAGAEQEDGIDRLCQSRSRRSEEDRLCQSRSRKSEERMQHILTLDLFLILILILILLID